MKKMLVVLVGVFVATGCSYEGQSIGSYFEHPTSIIKDPHYSKYQDEKDDLESAYLSKELSYADYVKETEELEDKYSQEVQERTEIILAPAN